MSSFKLTELTESIAAVNDQAVKSSLQMIYDAIMEVRAEIKELKVNSTQQGENIIQVQQRVNQLERYVNRPCVILNNCPINPKTTNPFDYALYIFNNGLKVLKI